MLCVLVQNEYTDWEKPPRNPIGSRDVALELLSDGHTVAPLIRISYMHSLRGGRSFFVHFKHRSTERGFSQVRLDEAFVCPSSPPPSLPHNNKIFYLSQIGLTYRYHRKSFLFAACFVNYSEAVRFMVKTCHFGWVFQCHRCSHKITLATISKSAGCSFDIWPISLIMGNITLFVSPMEKNSNSHYTCHFWQIPGIQMRRHHQYYTYLRRNIITSAQLPMN